MRISAAGLVDQLAMTLDWAVERVEHELAAVRTQIGPPWQKDHKEAAMAALVAVRSTDR